MILSRTLINTDFFKFYCECRKIFKCHHSSFRKKAANENNKGKSKNSGCEAKIEILIKLSTKDTKKKDVYIKVNR